ncbi:hypothetical protein RRG08_037812 [Elysia crispata]|uniref:Uncharacterized protein n=1 Tax=Elysia crispata TaxID=231223 RepID=A0AAE1BC02_9GAST|nr:hypothetical protein RRG08_037812 [Elysia crispata]
MYKVSVHSTASVLGLEVGKEEARHEIAEAAFRPSLTRELGEIQTLPVRCVPSLYRHLVRTNCVSCSVLDFVPFHGARDQNKRQLVVNLYRWSVIPSPSVSGKSLPMVSDSLTQLIPSPTVGGKSLPMLVVNLYRWSVIPSPSVGGKSLPMWVVNLYRWSVIPSPTVGGKSLTMVSDSTLEDNEIDQISSS